MSLPHLPQVKHSTHSNGYQGQRRSQKLWVIKPWRQQDGWKIPTKPDSSGNPHSKRKDLTHTSCALAFICAQWHECSHTWPPHDLHMCTMAWMHPTWEHNILKEKYVPFQRFLKCWCVWVFCLHYVFVPHTCVVPTGATRGYWLHWDWSHRWLWAAMEVLEIKPGPGKEKLAFLTAESSLQLLNK